jgi:hypothetical protein
MSLKEIIKQEVSNFPSQVDSPTSLLLDETFKTQVAPSIPLPEWIKYTSKEFNNYLVVIDKKTYWGSPAATEWAIGHMPDARPAFPHLDDL